MKYFDDFFPGEVEKVGEYHLNQEEIIEFALKWDPQPFHIDPIDAKKSVFSGLIAAGPHLLAITVRLLGIFQPKVAVLAGLGWDEVRFLEPARPGDTLSIFRECLEVRPSTSKSDRGIVRNRLTLKNQKGQHVMSLVATALVAKKPFY
ncbi:putative dehydratase, MaoC-like domain [uncultured Desulfobacterium sp.]|uniref:Putative dehydratase, MaoC-like domain n=1 Tax=uncultured Desulfobacterium sp. TaxID=201089 RepID=A0A445N418_9BACT|nr:putative dehydratase, MaoC-like domain [uncultured Desulfobacterium sp.]